MKFLGLGVPELLIILAVALLIFGPKNLPKLGSAIGSTVRNLRDGMGDGDKGKDAAVEEIVEEEPEPEPVAPKATKKISGAKEKKSKKETAAE